jgi:cytochrome c oxidase subunit IV
MTEQQNQPVFREVQQWNPLLRWSLVLLMLVTAALTVVAAAATMRDSSERVAPLVLIACGVLLPSRVALLALTARLETEVRPEGLFVRYVPFHVHGRQFRPQELSEFYARQYKPIREYGGWGIRYGWNGRAYNVSGNEGVQLIFTNGKRLLIGSKRPYELESAIRSIMDEK